MIGNNFSLRASINLLEKTPRVLRAWLVNLSDEWVHAKIDDDSFSPFDVVGHLIHGEKTDWIPRIHLIMEHGAEKPFEPFDRFAMLAEHEGRTIGGLIDEFEKLRHQSLAELTSFSLKVEDLDRVGLHPALGEVTLRQLLAAWVAHDLSHMSQIARTLAERYRDDVGPWVAAMGVYRSGERDG